MDIIMTPTPKNSCASVHDISKVMEVTTKYCGNFRVYVQGTQDHGKVAFLTVHDVGSNHVPFCDFVASEPMKEVAKNSVWLHVCLPGQDQGNEEIPENTIYPTLDAIAHDLLTVLDLANLKAVIGLGEGAGANVLLRFGLMYSNRCFGLVLVDGSGSAAGVDERLSSTLSHLVENGRKFMSKFTGVRHHDDRTRPAVAGADANPEITINAKNIEKYAESYANRSDINKFLLHDLNVDCLVVTGKLSAHKLACEELVSHMDKIRTTLLVVDDAHDVIYEMRKDTVRSLILFCKGCGVLIGVPMLGLEREFSIVKEQEQMGRRPSQQTEAQKELTRQIKMYEELLYEKFE